MIVVLVLEEIIVLQISVARAASCVPIFNADPMHEHHLYNDSK